MRPICAGTTLRMLASLEPLMSQLSTIPQGHAAVQQHGPLGGNGGIERRGLTACQRIALVGRHRHTEARGHHTPKSDSEGCRNKRH